jgi:hypothetical protein
VLEGVFDAGGDFVFIPIHVLDKMAEVFRRRVIRFFLDIGLITKSFASNLLSWKNSGFSIDASLRLYGSDSKKRESIAQYLVRPPLSLIKIRYEPFKGRVLYKTKYNEYFGDSRFHHGAGTDRKNNAVPYMTFGHVMRGRAFRASIL